MNNKTINSIRLVNTAIFGSILIALIFLFIQVRDANNAKKVDLTYSIYKDMQKWEAEHPEAKDWLVHLDKPLKDNYDKWKFDDYLTFYESIYNLDKRNMLDHELVYTLFSDYFEEMYKANNFELLEIIKDFRKEQNGDPTLFKGVEDLYKEFSSESASLKKK